MSPLPRGDATRSSRRAFLHTMMTAAAGTALAPALRGQDTAAPRVPLGLDAHSLRAFGWKARQFIAYAAEQKLDAVLFNTLKSFESLEPAHLRELQAEAAAQGIRIYLGVGSVARGSKSFSKQNASAEALLAEGIRAAQTVGSPVVTCQVGSFADRSTPGGIEARMEELIQALQSVRTRAQDAGVKLAVENHAGDLRSEEVLRVIEAVGADVTGAMLDPGNAVWAMEDPMRQIELLGRHVLCTSVRDWTAWQTPEGATVQWTAIGDGLMDAPAFVGQMAKLCPGVPLNLEIISNLPRSIPFLKREHWEVYPALRAVDLVDFLALCRRGRPIAVVKPEPGADARAFEQEHQRAELERSLAHIRRHCPVGRRA